MSPTAQLEIRPIRPSDRAAVAAAFERMSDESRYRRFMAAKPELSSRELDQLTELDHVTHEALVAVTAEGEVVGEARYAAWHGRPGVADLAFMIADDRHGRGLGTELARQAVESARRNGFTRLTASTLWENEAARRVLGRLGFRPCGAGGGVVDFRLDLHPAAAAAA